MHSRTRTTIGVRHILAAAVLAGATAGAVAQVSATRTPGTPGLKEFFEAAWARQPEALALQNRREAAQAQRRAAESWTPEPPALGVSYKSDRLTGNDGARELEVGVAVPLWLPGERSSSGALAEAEAAALESRSQAARMRLAAKIREVWWAWQRAGVEVNIARGQLDSARRLAADVSRRAKAGELARADQHQADGAVAAAEAGLAQAEAGAMVALQQLKALSGSAIGTAPAMTVASEPEPSSGEGATHPEITELQDRANAAERAAALAATQSRANPELALATTRDRGISGEAYGQTVRLAILIPFGGGPRHDSRVASALADAAEAKAQLALDRVRLESERGAAVARVEAARVQLAAAERRATLARETRGFFEKSFRLGETDLPTRLRIEAEAAEAERQAARSRIDLAAAISSWRQTLGLLPL
ncbi:MAG: TolC family protein [Burkholderiales bacterium]|nr:TolC family protein [Burkholderiales bacterium]